MKTSFAKELAFSESIAAGPDVLGALVRLFPGASRIERADVADDRNGTDYWVQRAGLPPLSIDFKIRRFDPLEKWNSDDVLLETTSVYRGPGPPFQDQYRLKFGWTIDPAKRTDFICYSWLRSDGTARYWVVNYPLLNAATHRNLTKWTRRYRERATQNSNYKTLWIAVLRREVLRAIEEISSGVAA